jgi:hypothetical protein
VGAPNFLFKLCYTILKFHSYEINIGGSLKAVFFAFLKNKISFFTTLEYAEDNTHQISAKINGKREDF